jgi:hypothetical protein
MIIVDPYVAITLLFLVSVAALAAVAILGVVVSRVALVHHRRRVARHESIPSYYRHLAVGH